MTARELMERLNALPEEQLDLPVLAERGASGDLEELDTVEFYPEATMNVSYQRTTRKELAIYNGQEVMVDVPTQLPVYTYHPGVVLS